MSKDINKKTVSKDPRTQRLRRALVSIRTSEMNRRPQEFFPVETTEFRELTWKMQSMDTSSSRSELLLPDEMIRSLIKPE